MRQHRPLGLPGGAGGVEQPGDLPGFDAGVLELPGFCGEQLLVVEDLPPGPGGRDHPGGASNEPGDLLQRPGELGRGQHRFRFAVVDDVGELARVQAEVDRHRAAAGLEAGEHRLQHLRAVVHQHGDVVPPAGSEAPQPVGQLVGAPVELRVGLLPGALHRGRIVRKAARGLGQ